MALSHFCLILSTFLLVSNPVGISATLLTDEQIAAIEEIIVTKFMGEQNVPGMSISVVQGESFEQVWARGYGHSDIAKNISATNETLFGIGSLSKMISSIFVVKVITDKFSDMGEKVLDTPIRTLAPQYNLTFIDRYRSEYMTFRDLLTHKVCIALSTEICGAAGAFEDKYDVVYRQRYCPESCGFRSTNWAYNHAMVHLAAEVAGFIHGSGEDFEDMLVRFLQDDVGMKDTRTIHARENLDALPNMSQPYYRREGEFRPYNTSLLTRAGMIPAAGGILTTAADMTHFMAMIGSYGVRMDGTRVVQENVMKWITRNSNPFLNAPFKSNEGDRPRGDVGYGLGLILGSSDGWERLRHTGYIAPYTATMNVFPKLKLGVFTVASGPGMGPNHDMIHNLVFDLVQGFAAADQIAEQNYEPSTFADYLMLAPEEVYSSFAAEFSKPTIFENTAIATNAVSLNHSNLIGIYGLGVAGQFELFDIDEATLYLQFGEFGTGYLRQVNESTPAKYEGELDSDLPQQWYADYDGANFPEFSVDFSIPLIAGVKVGNDVYPFIKGFTLDMLPEQPWADDSC